MPTEQHTWRSLNRLRWQFLWHTAGSGNCLSQALLVRTQDSTPVRSTPQSFPALRHPGYRVYFMTPAIAMMANNIEHVITYWVMYQKFQSQTLAGFAVISRWLPFLLFSTWSGALADRYNPRRQRPRNYVNAGAHT